MSGLIRSNARARSRRCGSTTSPTQCVEPGDVDRRRRRFSGSATTTDLRCIVLRGAPCTEAFGSAPTSRSSPHPRRPAAGRAFARHTHRAFHGCGIARAGAGRDPRRLRGWRAGAGVVLRPADLHPGQPLRCAGRAGRRAGLSRSWRAGALVGPNGALEVLLEGRFVGGAEALAKGWSTGSSTPPASMPRSSTVQRIAPAPAVARCTRSSSPVTHGQPLTEAELEEGVSCFETEDYAIGYRDLPQQGNAGVRRALSVSRRFAAAPAPAPRSPGPAP